MVYRQNGIGQNGIDKMVQTNWYRQNGTDKMVWIKSSVNQSIPLPFTI